MDEALQEAVVDGAPTLFLIQLAVLLLPGVIWARIDSNYGANHESAPFEFAVRSVLFGLSAHVLTYAAFLAARMPYEIFDFAAASQQNVLTRALLLQTAAAIGVRFVASVVWLYAINYKWLTRFLQSIHATNRYGDEDLWEYTFNASDLSTRFVHVRDFANKVVYAGWVDVFSETNKLRELVLSEVDIYDTRGTLIASPPQLYISFRPDAVHIEFPIQPKPNEKANVDELSPEVRSKPWLFHNRDRGSDDH